MYSGDGMAGELLVKDLGGGGAGRMGWKRIGWYILLGEGREGVVWL